MMLAFDLRKKEIHSIEECFNIGQSRLQSKGSFVLLFPLILVGGNVVKTERDIEPERLMIRSLMLNCQLAWFRRGSRTRR